MGINTIDKAVIKSAVKNEKALNRAYQISRGQAGKEREVFINETVVSTVLKIDFIKTILMSTSFFYTIFRLWKGRNGFLIWMAITIALIFLLPTRKGNVEIKTLKTSELDLYSSELSQLITNDRSTTDERRIELKSVIDELLETGSVSTSKNNSYQDNFDEADNYRTEDLNF